MELACLWRYCITEGKRWRFHKIIINEYWNFEMAGASTFFAYLHYSYPRPSVERFIGSSSVRLIFPGLFRPHATRNSYPMHRSEVLMALEGEFPIVGTRSWVEEDLRSESKTYEVNRHSTWVDSEVSKTLICLAHEGMRSTPRTASIVPLGLFGGHLVRLISMHSSSLENVPFNRI